MSVLKWLHFSDLHFNPNDQFDTVFAREKLIEYIQSINIDYDYIFITGDIANKNDYSQIQPFFNKLLSALKVKDKNIIFCTVGNHDISRNRTIRNGIIKDIRAKGYDASRQFELTMQDNEKREILSINGMSDYYNNQQMIFENKFSEDNIRSIHNLYEFEFFNLLILNTCLTSCDGSDHLNLFIVDKHLLNIMNKINDRKMTIAIGHHGYEFLALNEQVRLCHIFDNKIDLYLCGHAHRIGYSMLNDAKNNIHQLTCGSISTDSGSLASFMFGSYDTLTHQIEIVPYSYRDNGTRTWDIDYNLHRKLSKDTILKVDRLKNIEFKENLPADKILNIINDVQTKCISFSSVFLNRFKHYKHEDLYIQKSIDEKISSLTKYVIPSSLKITKKRTRLIENKKVEYETERQVFAQVVIVRDYSGSGKTTFAIEHALMRNKYFSASQSARESNIDISIKNLLESLGPDNGLNTLVNANMPLIITIDSLDEALDRYSLLEEIKSINKYITTLNDIAIQKNMSQYPIVIIYTIREEYWRNFESLFEGVNSITYRTIFSEFTKDEFFLALTKYQNVYDYHITSKLSPQNIEVLLIPFNLLIFSETHQDEKDIVINNIFTKNVMHYFFEKKSLCIRKRTIPALNPFLFLCICSSFIYRCIARESIAIRKSDFFETLKREFAILYPYGNDLLIIYESERIFSFDEQEVLRIKHMKFLEYLVAFEIVNKTSKMSYDMTNVYMKDFMNHMSRINYVDSIEIYDNVKFISRSYDFFNNNALLFFDKSNSFIASLLQSARAEIAGGGIIDDELLNKLNSGYELNDPNLVWESFYILAAKRSSTSRDNIIKAFLDAWQANKYNDKHKHERWKLLVKLDAYSLLLNNKVISAFLSSDYWKDWQVYLGCIIKYTGKKIFADMYNESEVDIKKYLGTGEEWDYTYNLLKSIAEIKNP